MNKGVLVIIGIIAISVIIYGAMAAQHGKTLANVDEKLKEVDAAGAHLIDTCKTTFNDADKITCDSNVLSLYHNECVQYPDKLSICKSGGAVEQYLKAAGYI